MWVVLALRDEWSLLKSTWCAFEPLTRPVAFSGFTNVLLILVGGGCAQSLRWASCGRSMTSWMSRDVSRRRCDMVGRGVTGNTHPTTLTILCRTAEGLLGKENWYGMKKVKADSTLLIYILQYFVRVISYVVAFHVILVIALNTFLFTDRISWIFFLNG